MLQINYNNRVCKCNKMHLNYLQFIFYKFDGIFTFLEITNEMFQITVKWLPLTYLVSPCDGMHEMAYWRFHAYKTNYMEYRISLDLIIPPTIPQTVFKGRTIPYIFECIPENCRLDGGSLESVTKMSSGNSDARDGFPLSSTLITRANLDFLSKSKSAFATCIIAHTIINKCDNK